MFWSVRGEKLSIDQINRILSFWIRCLQWSRETEGNFDRLLSKLSLLICYFEVIDTILKDLLLEIAPHVHVGYNADNLVCELTRLVENSPDQVSIVFGKLLETSIPSYDFEDKWKNLLIKLMQKGKRSDVISYADKLRDLPGMVEFWAKEIRSNSNELN